MAEMEIETGDDILRKVAVGGSMDYSSWPELLPAVLARLERIAHTEFPIPNIPSPHPPARPPSPRFLAPLPSSDPIDAPESSQETNKQDNNLSSPSGGRNNGARANTAPASTADAPPSASNPPTLPKPVADMLDEILSVLRNNFSQYPPHTIQRLSELVLSPRRHYRHLVPYLHALDRVVHVTSGANVYPLPPALPDISAMSLLSNGVGTGSAGSLSINTSAANSIGSDEALGGALLTPIPWLARRANGGGSEDGSDLGSSSPLSAGGEPTQQFPFSQQQQQQQHQRQGGQMEGRVRTESTETIEGPNGMGSIETVSVSVNGIPSMGAGGPLLSQRSVTQGELLRQEQRAGVVPLSQLSRHQQQQHTQTQTQDSANCTADGDAAMTEGADDEEEEIPHARGPEEIGPADTGRDANYMASGGALDSHDIDVEAAVGRRHQQDTESRASSGSSPESAAAMIPRSPKREAADDLEQTVGRKRIKEDDPSTSGSSAGQQPSNDTTTTTTPNPNTEPKPQEPKRDAEGDIVLPDRAAAATATAEPSISNDTTITIAVETGSESESCTEPGSGTPTSKNEETGAQAEEEEDTADKAATTTTVDSDAAGDKSG